MGVNTYLYFNKNKNSVFFPLFCHKGKLCIQPEESFRPRELIKITILIKKGDLIKSAVDK